MVRRHPYALPKGLRWAVFVRDGGCVLAKLEPGHECRDVWSQTHAANDFDRLTLEHVKSELRMGVRAPNDAAHLVTLCGLANFEVPSKAQRVAMRGYLAVWPLFIQVFKADQWDAYLSTPAPIFDGRSAGSLIFEGRADDVLGSLDQLASGAFV